MAIPLGFNNFVSGDVLTAADANGYLMQGIWTFADAAARDADVTSPEEGNACYLKDTDVIQVYDGSIWVTKSAGGASGGGKVLQVVAAYTTTATTNSTITYADTTLTATITPTLNTSTVLVFVSQNGLFKSQTNQFQGVVVRLLRTSSELTVFATSAGYNELTQRNTTAGSVGFLDSPATTSATTYKTQFKCMQAEQLVTVQFLNAESSIILMEIGA